jgi:hypothetical protein
MYCLTERAFGYVLGNDVKHCGKGNKGRSAFGAGVLMPAWSCVRIVSPKSEGSDFKVVRHGGSFSKILSIRTTHNISLLMVTKSIPTVVPI